MERVRKSKVILRGGLRKQNTRVANKAAKKYQEKAHLNALISSNKSFAMQRLMRDYNEIKNQTTPIAGVSAHPLEDDFFEWHGNIKANTQNIYKGAVMHFRFVFPENYPMKGPKIYLLNDKFRHPNVMPDGTICLDMLEENSKDLFRGWTSGYTVLSILLQLQSFFFEVDESILEDKEAKKEINNAVRAMNEFNCSTCKHKGSANPWPEFIKGDQEPSLYKMSQSKYREALLKELVCYHRKTTFEETPLGLGINILKIPRTGEIKGLVPALDFVSLKAYTKERLRRSMSGERFTHWFPLYFGVKQEQFLHLVKKSLSMICTGTTKLFSADMVIKVMPKFFTNLVADIVSEKTYLSCRALKIMIYIFRICSLLVQVYPSVKDEIEANLYKFINDPASRVKDSTPSLGDLLTMMTLSSNHKIEELLGPYIDEQLDRQIFWILQSLPEFEELINSSSVDDIRAKVCFKAGIVGHQILLFYYYFIKKIQFKDSNSLAQINATLDQNHCNLSNEQIDSHQKEIQKILKIDSFREYYKYLNVTAPSDKELNEKLKAAFINSFNKGYHGKDEVRFVPDESEQIKVFFGKFPSLDKLVNEEGHLLPENDLVWKDLVLQKFDQVTRMRYRYPSGQLTPFEVAKYCEEIKYEYIFSSESNTSKFTPKGGMVDMFNYYKFKEVIYEDKYLELLSWRQLYLKLLLESYIKYFRYSADFKFLYALLDLCKNDIIHLNLYVHSSNGLKSDHNYLRVVLSKLTKIKQLNIFYVEEVNLKMIKNILKGINNLNSSGGEINTLKIWVEKRARKYTHKDYNILTVIDKLPHLKVLDVSDTEIDINAALRIRNHLYYFKSIETLNLSGCGMTDPMAKEIADGIMKAKSLENIYLRNNSLAKGLANVLYNLAFQPSLKVIDISGNSSADVIETGTALYKLIKMSQSLEVLICQNIPGLIDNLTNEFYYSLGDNSSLKYLDLSNSGNICQKVGHVKLLGSAVSFNALKKGALKTLIISKTSLVYDKFVDFIEGMHINEEIHFQWYGTSLDSSIQKDSKEYFEKKFYCKLSHLDISENNMHCNVNINDLKTVRVNHLRILLENNLSLESLNFSSTPLNKLFIEMIVNALNAPNGLKYLNLDYSWMKGDLVKCLMGAFSREKENVDKTKERIYNTNMHLEGLSLAKNEFGYSGIEALSIMLKENRTIRILNLYKNLFDVNGARRLKDTLEVNTALEAIDISYNRIKDLGFTNIVDAILRNKENRIRYLACRYNFIKNANLTQNLERILSGPNSRIETLELINNSFDDKTVLKVYNEIYAKSERKVKIDFFEMLHYLTPEKLERTIWISPLNYSENAKTIATALKVAEKVVIEEDNSHLGIPLNIFIRRGRKMGEKKNAESVDAFVEFICPNSVNRMLKVAATDGFLVNEKKMRVYKAGTKPDRLIIKKKKQI